MYGAGRLERRNIKEYETAERLAAWLPMWPAPPAREEIRASFARETSVPAAIALAGPTPGYEATR